MAGGSFDRYASTGDAIVVYSDAYEGLWHDARSGLSSPAKMAGTDDVEFLTALIKRMRERFGTDRVILAGYFNGGQMVIRFIREAPGWVNAAGIVAATLPTPGTFDALDRYQPLPLTVCMAPATQSSRTKGVRPACGVCDPAVLACPLLTPPCTLPTATESPPNRSSVLRRGTRRRRQ